MKRILILDTETTTLQPADGRLLEVAATLYSVDHACPVRSFSTLIAGAEENPAERINRIPVAAVEAAGMPEDEAWQIVRSLFYSAEAVVAHRAEFDRQWVPLEMFDRHPWICSKFDLTWPCETRPGGSLVTLALEHGLGVAQAHRAAADVDLLVRLFQRVHEMGVDVAAMLARGLRPKAIFAALVSYGDRGKAKDAGFQWEPTQRLWLRRMAVEDAVALGFPVRRQPEV